MPSLYEVDGDTLRLNFHAGQARAWDSNKRFIAVLAGAQSGKTSWGPLWLWREIMTRGKGDYLAVTSSYDLFKLKMLPALRELFEGVFRTGRYWSGDRVIELADPTTGRFLASRADDEMWGRIILRSAESGSGLESTTGKGAWLDEAGQPSFTEETWEAVQRRMTLNLGRVLMTTTLYNFGWLKAKIYDPWKKGDPSIDVVQFDSTENPLFPVEEFRRARASMPPWRFAMQYRGRFERPAGMIYDCFRDSPFPFGHIIPAAPIPPAWSRFLGLDFGGTNTAGIFFAQDPATRKYHAYREYLAGGLTAAGHARALLAGEPRMPTCVGGSPSEGQWRGEFAAGGLPVYAPDIKDVELGIGRVYGAIKADDVLVHDSLTGLLSELGSYSRKLDAAGNPTEVIEAKETYHRLDAVRYILGWLNRPQSGPARVARPTPAYRV